MAERALKVVNDNGRAFNVSIEQSKYQHDPIVIFWDATHEDDDKFPELGQRVSSYFLSTLAGHLAGLDLCAHVSVWNISAQNVADAVAFVFKTPITGGDEG